MNYYIQIRSRNKAKIDIDVLFRDMGYKNLTPNNNSGNAIMRFILRLIAVSKILFTLHKGDVLCLQYPMKKFFTPACRLTHAKGAKVITIVHDLGAFRRHKLTIEQENRRLANSDVIIVHNERMKEHLLANGCKQSIITLGIFDYLTETESSHTIRKRNQPCKVAFAGNLARWRNEFLYHLEEETTTWTLEAYGKGFDESHKGDPHLHNHNMISPDDFVAQCEADFGLVWDGSSLDECDGEWGRYLLVNNPHKTSFYLRAGIPVIVWAESAMAPFILEHGIGIAIHSIRELKDLLVKMPDETYSSLKSNAINFSKLLGNGTYTRRAFHEAMKSTG